VRYNLTREAELTGSPSLLRSAIENVVRKCECAIRAEGSDVDVSLEVETNFPGNGGVIRVSDHGPGVPGSGAG